MFSRSNRFSKFHIDHSRSFMNAREKNKIIWKDTVKHSLDNPPPPSSSKYSHHLLGIDLPENPKHCTSVQVYNTDTLDLAFGAITLGYNTAILNMANNETPGGGVRNGATAQEECIFRRSNIFMTLTDNLYKLDELELIYTPKFTIFKDSEYNYYSDWSCSCISIAALRKHPGTKLYSEQEREIMKAKIELMFRIGIVKGHDCLVLGAFGCGAFYNPPFEVMKLFREVMTIYNGYFKCVLFAVKSGSGNINYKTFKLLELE